MTDKPLSTEPDSAVAVPDSFETKPLISVSYRTLFVIGVIAITQGLTSLSDLAIAYLCKDEFRLNPAAVSLASSIICIPWMIKPLWGFTSDCFPILGLRRLPYLVIFSSLGVCFWISLGFAGTVVEAVVILFFNNVCSAFCNVIGEALVVQESQRGGGDQAKASRYVSTFFAVRSVGIIITSYLSGALIEVLSVRTIFCITAACPAITLVCSTFLQEERVHSSQELTASSQFKEFWGFLSRREVFLPVLFIFIFMSTPYCGDAMFFYYTNKLGFSPEFMGRLKMVQGFASLIGICVYNQWLRDVSFKSIIISTTIIYSVVSSSQLLLVTRLNIYLGIPDFLFCLASSFLQVALGELNSMPMLVLCARICPKNIEGTMYAFLMSVINFGGMVSMALGSLLMVIVGVDQSHFGLLWLLILISNLTALLPLPMLIWLRVPKPTYEPV
jgi:folate/biopterin transporter